MSTFDHAALVLDDRAEAGLDRFDSEKIGGGLLSLTFFGGHKELVINSLPLREGGDTVEVATRVPEEGLYTISTSSTISTNSTSSTTLNIQDLRTGISQPLSPDHPFTFQASAGDQSGRFRLILSTNGGRLDFVEKWKSDNVIFDDRWRVHSDNGQIYFDFIQLPDEDSNVIIIDGKGTTALTIPIDAQMNKVSASHSLAPGIYYASFQGNKNYPTLKFFVN